MCIEDMVCNVSVGFLGHSVQYFLSISGLYGRQYMPVLQRLRVILLTCHDAIGLNAGTEKKSLFTSSEL